LWQNPASLDFAPVAKLWCAPGSPKSDDMESHMKKLIAALVVGLFSLSVSAPVLAQATTAEPKKEEAKKQEKAQAKKTETKKAEAKAEEAKKEETKKEAPKKVKKGGC
jgi:mannitol-specific phosphotransferase system IIBC component